MRTMRLPCNTMYILLCSGVNAPHFMVILRDSHEFQATVQIEPADSVDQSDHQITGHDTPTFSLHNMSPSVAEPEIQTQGDNCLAQA